MSIQSIVNHLAREWSVPRTPIWSKSRNAPRLRCTFAAPAAASSKAQMSAEPLPADLAAFWRLAGSARLFEDPTYGQWGLEIMTRAEGQSITIAEKRRRSHDFLEGDLVVGRFLGDSDLLVVRTDPAEEDFGHVLVALPIDPRDDWYHVSQSFTEFLATFARSEGRKYWE